jgi:DNA-binding CsgD family transcriptional regulator
VTQQQQLNDIALFTTFQSLCRRCETSALIRLSMSLWRDGRFAESTESAAKLAGRWNSGCTGMCSEFARIWHTTLYIKVRDLRSARRVLGGVDVQEGNPEAPDLRAALSIMQSSLAFVEGDIDVAMAKADEGLQITERYSVRPLRPVAHVVLALSALRRTDVRTGIHFAGRLGGHALLGESSHMPGQSAWAVAQVQEAHSGPAGAAHLISGIIANPPIIHDLLASEPAAAAWLVRISRRLGYEELAEIPSAVAQGLVTRSRTPLLVHKASSLHAAGVFEKDPEKIFRAIELYPDLWAGASAREDFAELLLERHSHREEAVENLDTALAGYAKAGSPRDVSRVTNKLWEIGVRRSQTRVAKRDRVADHGLTDTEFAVAELVSLGFTNPEVGKQLFISRNTVAFHLRKVFRKMNVTSRVELAGVWNKGVAV